MKILLASVDFAPDRNGVSTLSYHYARRLAERGHDVSVVGPRVAGHDDHAAAYPFWIRRFRGYHWGVFRAIPFGFATLSAMVRRKPELVMPMNIAYGGILCWMLSLLRCCRYVTTAYAFEFMKFKEHPFMRRLYVAIYTRSICVIAISNFTKAQLLEFGVPESKIIISYPGVNASSPRKPDHPSPSWANDLEQHLVIGTCGRLIYRKGHDLVLEALPTLVKKHPDLLYLVAGTGPEEIRLKEQCDRLGLQNHVRWLGEVSDEDLQVFYRHLDVFVMPSRLVSHSGHAEGFGIVYVEAALHGVPSVGTRSGGIPEAVLDGRTGMLIPCGDEKALGAALQELLANESLRHRLGRAAMERASTELTWDRQVDLIVEHLNTVA